MSEQDSPASKCGKCSQQIEFRVDAATNVVPYIRFRECRDIVFALNDDNINHKDGNVHLSNSI